MDWRTAYRDRIVSTGEAAARIKPGDYIRMPLMTTPAGMVAAIARRKDELTGVRVYQPVPVYPHPWANDSSWQGKVDLVTDFVSNPIREGADGKLVDIVVSDYALGSRVTRDGRDDNWSSDVFIAPITEPDAHGFVSFGFSLWHAKSLARHAKLRIGEITPGLIRTGGDNFMHISEFDVITECDVPLPDLRTVRAGPPLGDEEAGAIEVIGHYASTVVRDGDTVQLGTGTVSSSVGMALMEKRDLGIDAEILVPAAVELVKAGVATGRNKTMHKHAATASLVVPGCDMEFVDGNPQFELHDIEYCNFLPRMASQENLVTINNAGTMDLTGQVGAESWGHRVWSGPGGQLVWTMAGMLSRGGRAVTVLTTTAENGAISRIVPALEPGTVVTVPRAWIDWVITEYGMVNLQGKTQRERAEALIAIAHPKFRDELRDAAKKLYWP